MLEEILIYNQKHEPRLNLTLYVNVKIDLNVKYKIIKLLKNNIRENLQDQYDSVIDSKINSSKSKFETFALQKILLR